MFSFIVTSCNLHLGSICITDPVSTCNYLSVSVLAVEKIMYQHVKVLQSVSVLKTFGCVREERVKWPFNDIPVQDWGAVT